MAVLPRSFAENNSPFSWIMEGLLAHYFSPNRSSYATEDVRWLLKFANTQNQWRHLQAEVIEMSVKIVAANAEDDLESVVNQMNTEVMIRGINYAKFSGSHIQANFYCGSRH